MPKRTNDNINVDDLAETINMDRGLILIDGLLQFNRDELAACGARIVLQGHQSVAAAVKALHDTYTHLFNGGAPADLKSKIASSDEMNKLTRSEEYKGWQKDYLR